MPGPYRASRYDIADIVRAHRPALESLCALSASRKRVLTDIAQCRTEKLGGHRDRCTQCTFERPVYNSCRNRHCPKCQGLAQERWIEAQRARTLDLAHFHVVFTLPAELRQLTAFAPRVVYGLLFSAVADTLMGFGERRFMATIGATLVLHTWRRDLAYHPHIHAVVTAGGLAFDDRRFVRSDPDFLFPVKALGKVFRSKMLAALWDAYRAGDFSGFTAFEDPQGFATLINSLPKPSWYTYAKRSFGKAEHVLQYLGRYTHRVAISNSRLLDVTQDRVTFRTRGDGTATVTPVEFLRRFVQHVLPKGFHKIRHVGLNASAKRRTIAASLLGIRDTPRAALTWQQRLLLTAGRDPTSCPHCGAPLQGLPLLESARARAPPPHRSAA